MAAKGMARGTGRSGGVKTVVEMPKYCAAVRTKPRWPCVPPPRYK